MCCGRLEPDPVEHPKFQFVVTAGDGTVTVFDSQNLALASQRGDLASRMVVRPRRPR